jgi:hypothetical protein
MNKELLLEYCRAKNCSIYDIDIDIIKKFINNMDNELLLEYRKTKNFVIQDHDAMEKYLKENMPEPRSGKCTHDCGDTNCPHKQTISPLAMAMTTGDMISKFTTIDLSQFRPKLFPIEILKEKPKNQSDLPIDTKYKDNFYLRISYPQTNRPADWNKHSDPNTPKWVVDRHFDTLEGFDFSESNILPSYIVYSFNGTDYIYEINKEKKEFMPIWWIPVHVLYYMEFKVWFLDNDHEVIKEKFTFNVVRGILKIPMPLFGDSLWPTNFLIGANKLLVVTEGMIGLYRSGMDVSKFILI